MLGLDGVTVIDTGKSAKTVSVVLPEIAPQLAVMVDVPPATPVASPVELIVATDVVPETQLNGLSICEEPSE